MNGSGGAGANVRGSLVGEVLAGTYRLEQLVGGGGFADVYRAQVLATGADVALKVLHPHMAREPDLVRRFAREAQLAARLDEPHIVRVLGSGDDRGTHFIVMEFVRGRTLDRVLAERGPLPPAEVAALGCQALEALGAAHAAGIVHRDVKPQNLMLTTAGLLKVMDFGIAKQPTSQTMTRTGLYLGTVQYMSPEQARGLPADSRSDLYALAITLYELLVGRTPFDAATPWATLNLHATAPVPSPRQLRPGVPPQLELVLLRALAKDPARRFRNAAEMRAALAPLTTVRAPAPPIQPPRLSPSPSRSDRHWLPIAVTTGTLALLVGVLTVSRLPSQEPASPALPAAAVSATLQVADSRVPPPSITAALPTVPPTPLALSRLEAAQAIGRAGEPRQALALLSDLQRSEPTTPGLPDALYATHLEVGRTLLARDDLDGSAAAYAAAEQLRPADQAARDGLRQVALTRDWQLMETSWGKDDEATIGALERIWQRDPDYRQTRQKLGVALVAQAERLAASGERDAAVTLLLRAREVNPDDPTATTLLLDFTPTPIPPPLPTARPVTNSGGSSGTSSGTSAPPPAPPPPAPQPAPPPARPADPPAPALTPIKPVFTRPTPQS